MAKRSDFAQKLLDDLRVRKERMAASQSSKSSKPMAGDAYSYSKQGYKGTREMRTHQTNGIKNATNRKSTMGNKSFSIGEASKEIVPLGRGRSSEQFGDLSMALAFALENGGKLRRMDSSGNRSMQGFLNQIGGRSRDMGRMEISRVDRHKSATSQFPTLSHLHIEEIARGAQRLNQILRACSNGLNFDRYSIEIGKELLKGAVDLEESLRMLVNLQEASDYMIRPQSKTRITLLDDDDDDDSGVKTTENDQLARPMLYFDKPSRDSHYIQEAARIDLKQRLLTLAYQPDSTSLSHDMQTLSSSNSISHRRSASYSPNVKTVAAFTEQKNHSSSSKSKPEKKRIPNVIAKLMGLEELPENDDSKNISKKESSSKQKIERTAKKKTAEGSTVQKWKTNDSRTLMSPIRKNKQIQPNQIQETRDMIHGLQAERHASFEGTLRDGRPLQKDVEGIKPIKSSNKANMKMDNHQNNIGHLSQSNASRKDAQEKERKQDNTKLREQKGKEKGETKDQVLKHQLKQTTLQAQNGSEAAVALQGQAEFYLTMLKTKTRNTHNMPSKSQPNSPDDLAFQQSKMLQNFESQDTRHHAGEIEQQTQGKRQTGSESRSLPQPIHLSPYFPKKYSRTIQATLNNGSSRESIHTMQSMGFPNKKHHGDLAQDKSFTNIDVNGQKLMNKNSNQNSSPRNLNSEVIKEKNRTTIVPDMEENHVHLPTVQKLKVTKVQKVEAPQKIDKLVTRRSGNPQSLVKSPKYHTSILQEVKQRRQNKLGRSKEEEQVGSNRSREAEALTLDSNKSVSSKQQSNMLEELHSQAEQASNLFSPPADGDYQSLKGKEILAPNENSSTVLNVQQGQEPEFGVDKFKSHSIISDPVNWTHEGRKDVSYPSRLENQEVSTLVKLEPLTESENRLKQILIKSQQFLNTAEALFKLNIPFAILHAGGSDCPDAENKLVLDCAYEVMKRKGKRQELSVHPFMRVSISCQKVRSLDDLIKELHKDFEKLKFYGRNDKAECVVEDYLPKMLEIDVYNRDSDVNCMWEFGWHEMMFISIEKDEAVRDVERHVLNVLLDEVTVDLLPVS